MQLPLTVFVNDAEPSVLLTKDIRHFGFFRGSRCVVACISAIGTAGYRRVPQLPWLILR